MITNVFRIISLLNYIRNVSEWILVNRFNRVVETRPLFYKLRLGGRKQKSIIYTLLLLIDELESVGTNRRMTLIVSLDIEGVFNYV